MTTPNKAAPAVKKDAPEDEPKPVSKRAPERPVGEPEIDHLTRRTVRRFVG